MNVRNLELRIIIGLGLFLSFIMLVSLPVEKSASQIAQMAQAKAIRQSEMARNLLNQRKYVHDVAADKCILVMETSMELLLHGVTSCDGIPPELIIEPMGYISAPPSPTPD